MLRAHSQGAGCTLTRQQPENNVIRVTIQALAGVLGGALSLQTNSQDEAYAIPTEATVRTALRTQQIIAHESGVADFVDPLGGSYAIDAMGGAAAAIEKGFIQSEIAESAYQYQKAIESKTQVVVGVNDYVVEEATHINTTQIDAETEKIQIEKLQKIKLQISRKRWKYPSGGTKRPLVPVTLSTNIAATWSLAPSYIMTSLIFSTQRKLQEGCSRPNEHR